MEMKLEIVNWIKSYTKDQNFKLVVGISGGIDSAVVSTLCAMTGIDTYVVSIPIHQKKDQLTNAKNHINWLQNNFTNVIDCDIDMSSTFDLFASMFNDGLNSNLSLANSRSRLRMMTLYQISANINGIVVGTGNKVEDFGIGFFTKYGDGGVDISPIADINKSEVRQLARELNIIDDIIKASPTDGLWEDDRTDEDQIGATYEELEFVMDYKGSVDLLSDRQKEVLSIYNGFNTRNQHKMVSVPVFKNKKNEKL